MDDLKVLQHAKGYMDQLAQKVDPISGRAVPEDSVLNQERLIKCFQYVSQVLQREIDRNQETETFIMAEVIDEIYELVEYTGTKRMFSKAVYQWLIQEGYLMEQPRPDSQRSQRLPTQKGAAIGLCLREQQGRAEKTYMTVACGEQGRELLRNHGEQIVALASKLEVRQWEPLLACLTPEWHCSVACLPEAVSITTLLDRINSQLPEDLPAKLSATKVNMWLVKKGLLEDVLIYGRRRRKPTEAGKKLGINVEKQEKNGKRLKDKIKWSVPAQQFILDNLDAIVQDVASGAHMLVPREIVVTEEMRSKLISYPKIVPEAYLEKAINSTLGCGEQDIRVVPKGLISSWLYQEGYTCIPSDGFAVIPTEKGEAAGLVLNGGFVNYSEAGQRFIYDNLEKIFDYYKTGINKKRQ